MPSPHWWPTKRHRPKGVNMDFYLACKINRGLFSGEATVHGRGQDGVEFSLFLPEDYVDESEDASGGIEGEKDGYSKCSAGP